MDEIISKKKYLNDNNANEEPKLPPGKKLIVLPKTGAEEVD